MNEVDDLEFENVQENIERHHKRVSAWKRAISVSSHLRQHIIGLYLFTNQIQFHEAFLV